MRLGRAAFTGQAQRLNAESGIITPTFDGLRAVFHDMRKLRPYPVQVYPTTSFELVNELNYLSIT